MRLLLDTQIFLWWLADSRKLAEDWTHRYLAAAAALHADT